MNLKFNVPKLVLNYKNKVREDEWVGAYSSFSDGSFAKSVEIFKELFDSDSIF